MFEEHPTFVAPENHRGKIWRYMDFTKFVSLLDKQALFFARLDKLDDPFEGSCPRMNVEARPAQIESWLGGNPEGHDGCNVREKAAAVSRGFSFWYQVQRRWIGVNCWHLGERESAAMWRLYLKSNEGIAVQSTYCRLRDALARASETVWIGRVRYLDYDEEMIWESNGLAPIVCKRRSFQHEKELRAVIWHPPELPAGETVPYDDRRWETGAWETGVYVDVDLTRLSDEPSRHSR